MKRLVAIVAVLSLLLGAGVALWPDEPVSSAGSEETPRRPDLPSVAAANVVVEPSKLLPASVAGGVHRGGKGVAGARVIAKSERESFTLPTVEGGGFLLSLPADTYLISATFGDEATRAVGPLTLAPGEQKQGLVLELLPSATLEGVVLDELTRAPVPKARVAAAGVVVETSQSGRFQLKGIAVGEAWVEVSAKGFMPRIEWVTVDAARVLAGMEITLSPTATVKGTVTRAGQPIAGARVWSEGDVRAVTAAPSANTVSDLNGAFELAVPRGKTLLVASAPNEGRVAGPELNVSAGAVYEGVQIELGQRLVATGTVTVDAEPAPNAQLIIFDARSGRTASSAIADGAGHFAVSGLAPGTYLVQVKVFGLDAQRGPFHVTGAGDDHWNVVLERAGSIHGHVVPAEAGVLVRLRGTDWVGAGATTTTDAQGRFLFEGITNDSIVEAEGAKGFAEARVKPNQEVTLTLEPAVIRGSVTSEQGRAVTDFAIRLRPVKGGATRTHAVLSPTGRFRLPATPGEYEVSAFAPGTAWAEPVRGVAARGDSAAEVSLKLSQTTAIDGRVFDSATRQPVVGAEVQVRVGGAFSASVFATAVTGGSGGFSFNSVPLRAGLVASAPGYRPRFIGGVAASTQALEIGLERGEAPDWQKPYEGIGLSWNGSVPALSVAQVFVGTPAEEAGILPGDLLISIDGQPAAKMNMEQVINNIRGPAGTAVRLGFSRGGQPYEVTVRRRAISL